MAQGTPPPLAVSVRSEDGEHDFWAAFHLPGLTPVIPRVGAEMWLKDENGQPAMFVVRRVVHYTRDHPCAWYEGRIHPGTVGPAGFTYITPGITEVVISVALADPPKPEER